MSVGVRRNANGSSKSSMFKQTEDSVKSSSAYTITGLIPSKHNIKRMHLKEEHYGHRGLNEHRYVRVPHHKFESNSIFGFPAFICFHLSRYIAICHPLRAKSYCTVQKARIAVFVIWIVAMATCVPVVFLVVRYTLSRFDCPSLI